MSESSIGYVLRPSSVDRHALDLVHPNGGVLATIYDANYPDSLHAAPASEVMLAALNSSVLPLLEAAEAKLREERERSDAAEARLHRLSKIEAEHISFQSLVADCQCWFDGFLSAFVGKESWEKPWTPDTGRLRTLNDALRHVAPPSAADQKIPF